MAKVVVIRAANNVVLGARRGSWLSTHEYMVFQARNCYSKLYTSIQSALIHRNAHLNLFSATIGLLIRQSKELCDGDATWPYAHFWRRYCCGRLVSLIRNY